MEPADNEERPLPEGGAWRVHPQPSALPQLRHDGPGRNRYDDPYGQYTVRYVAENLTGALLETMARFRPSPAAERLLASVTGIEPTDVEHADPTTAVADWLAHQEVGRVRLAATAVLLDVHAPDLLRKLDKHPLVRASLENAEGLGTSLNPAHLDEGLIRLGGPLGRPITQAVSRAVREWLADVGGLAYRSRLDDAEWCWALWDDTAVVIEVTPLDATRRYHRRAVRQVAAALEVPLPRPWL